jgi:hypothetical protein
MAGGEDNSCAANIAARPRIDNAALAPLPAAFRSVSRIAIRPGMGLKMGLRSSRVINLPRVRSLTGVSGIEAVFSAHVGDERKVLAASDQTDNGGRHSVAAYLCFDDISLSATIRGIGTLSVYGRTVVDRALGDHCWKFCPMVFRRPGIAQRQRHRIHNHFLLFRGEIALADADAGGGRWRFARCKGSLSGGAL